MSDSILSDRLWQRIEPLLPKPKQRRNLQHAGRTPADARQVMTGIIFALKTGVPWKNLPATRDFPSGHSCRRRLLEWHARGVWRRLWQNILSEFQAEGPLSWELGVVDSSSVRAGHEGEKTGKSPVDRAKLGSKHHLLVEGRGVPLAARLTGANRHDITQLLTLVESLRPVRGKRGRPRKRPEKVQGDRAYNSEPHRRALRKRGSRRSERSGAPRTGADWGRRDGWSSGRCHGYISSGSCGCARRRAIPRMKPSCGWLVQSSRIAF